MTLLSILVQFSSTFSDLTVHEKHLFKGCHEDLFHDVHGLVRGHVAAGGHVWSLKDEDIGKEDIFRPFRAIGKHFEAFN